MLPLIEGTVISTKFGDINTSNILFICAGAFSYSKPTDLMPELQGRLPNKIELSALNRKDFRKILTEVENNLISQYQKLLGTEGITLDFTSDGLDSICSIAEDINLTNENLGARRLLTILEKVTENIGFEGPDSVQKHFKIDKAFIEKELKDYFKKVDLHRYLV